MSESKHTPGPWRTDTDIFHDRLDIRDESGRRIAVCMHDYPMSMTRHDANAHLIAAAPEMLEALEVVQQFIQNGIQYGYINMPDKDCGDSALETHAIIEAAIQKARGLQQ